jgi:hypothetical protein
MNPTRFERMTLRLFRLTLESHALPLRHGSIYAVACLICSIYCLYQSEKCSMDELETVVPGYESSYQTCPRSNNVAPIDFCFTVRVCVARGRGNASTGLVRLKLGG